MLEILYLAHGLGAFNRVFDVSWGLVNDSEAIYASLLFSRVVAGVGMGWLIYSYIAPRLSIAKSVFALVACVGFGALFMYGAQHQITKVIAYHQLSADKMAKADLIHRLEAVKLSNPRAANDELSVSDQIYLSGYKASAIYNPLNYDMSAYKLTYLSGIAHEFENSFRSTSTSITSTLKKVESERMGNSEHTADMFKARELLYGLAYSDAHRLAEKVKPQFADITSVFKNNILVIPFFTRSSVDEKYLQKWQSYFPSIAHPVWLESIGFNPDTPVSYYVSQLDADKQIIKSPQGNGYQYSYHAVGKHLLNLRTKWVDLLALDNQYVTDLNAKDWRLYFSSKPLGTKEGLAHDKTIALKPQQIIKNMRPYVKNEWFRITGFDFDMMDYQLSNISKHDIYSKESKILWDFISTPYFFNATIEELRTEMNQPALFAGLKAYPNNMKAFADGFIKADTSYDAEGVYEALSKPIQPSFKYWQSEQGQASLMQDMGSIAFAPSGFIESRTEYRNELLKSKSRILSEKAYHFDSLTSRYQSLEYVKEHGKQTLYNVYAPLVAMFFALVINLIIAAKLLVSAVRLFAFKVSMEKWSRMRYVAALFAIATVTTTVVYIELGERTERESAALAKVLGDSSDIGLAKSRFYVNYTMISKEFGFIGGVYGLEERVNNG
ncbi:hypothetical protein LMH73_020185, partial [Vibrio splendidus]